MQDNIISKLLGIFHEDTKLRPKYHQTNITQPKNVDCEGNLKSVAYPGIFWGGGRGGCDSTNSVEDRENGDLGAVAP